MGIAENVRDSINLLKGTNGPLNMSNYTNNPFGFITDQNVIKDALDQATNSAYDVKTKEAQQAMNKAENTTQANTRSAIANLRGSLAGSASSGANQGAANASALQAILGLGQQNNQTVTEGLQGLYRVADERAAALRQNAVDSISQANTAKTYESTSANERYASDANLAGIVDTNRANEAMNEATNKSNEKIANTEQKQRITYRGGYRVR